MQFKVPQDVQQADRIVSFLTLPQLIISIIGFAIAYGVYAVLNRQGLPLVFWLPPVLIIGALTLAFAFLKIANLPFHQYLALLIERFITPSKRVWVKGSDRVIDDQSYVSPEDKLNEEKNKKSNEIMQQKEEKLQKIEEITDILDTLKKEPEEEVLAPIDTAKDDSLLQKAFLEKTSEPAKKEETAEDKILAMSSQHPMAEKPLLKTEAAGAPAPSSAPVPAKTPSIVSTPTGHEAPATGVPEKKKRKRRRRRKKKTAEPSASIPPANSPAPSLSKTPETNTNTGVTPATEPKNAATTPPPKIEPAKIVSNPPQRKPEPELPGWLSTPNAVSEKKPAEAAKASDEAPATIPVPAEPKIEKTEPVTPPPAKTEERNAPPSAPEEKMLEAPEEELDLPAPEPELDLPAPPVELDLPAPAGPQPTNAGAPQESNPPAQKNDNTLKIEESFSPEELKQGKVIKIPKSNS